ncbi:MAG: hypothetical protein ABJ275_01035 [Maricaulaceae bacterium]
MKLFSTLPRKFYKIGLAALLATSAMAPLSHAFGVGVQPATVEMTIKPGENNRQTITIGNVHKEKTISLTISLADWTLDEDGELVLSPPGETDRSAADWVRFSPAVVTLKPETKQEISVEITAPFKIKDNGDHRFALLATTRLPSDRGDASGVWNKYQLASLFYLTTLPSKSLPVVKTEVVKNGGADLVSIEIENTGDAHARLNGHAIIKSSTGDTVDKVAVNTVVLDNHKRTIGVNLSGSDKLVSGETYNVDFDLNNSFVPQNKFRTTAVPVDSVTFKAK